MFYETGAKAPLSPDPFVRRQIVIWVAPFLGVSVWLLFGRYLLDAFQRGEFYNQTKPTGINPGYHVKLAFKTRAPLVVHVPTTVAAETTTVCGTHKLGGVEINYLDAQIQNYITGTLGSAATSTFPLFVLDNVVNFEICSYPSTDVRGVGEKLPFKDNSFDGVLSLSVLEHVRDPFACAREIARVLKPGGKLYSSIPFLQPLHGYPSHYFNMTHQGHKRLYEDMLEIDFADGKIRADWRVPAAGSELIVCAALPHDRLTMRQNASASARRIITV